MTREQEIVFLMEFFCKKAHEPIPFHPADIKKVLTRMKNCGTISIDDSELEDMSVELMGILREQNK